MPQKTGLRFIGNRAAVLLSCALLVASLLLVAVKGLNPGMDFTGGTLVEAQTPLPVDLAQMRRTVADAASGHVALQRIGEDAVQIRTRADDADAVKEALAAEFIGIRFPRSEPFGPVAAREVGLPALGLALLAVMGCLWFRFGWRFGVSGVLALLHDATLLAGFHALLGLEVGLASVAAVLAALGYAFNDSMVLYDRIRENLRKNRKMPVNAILDLSINETLPRTVTTGGTALLALAVLAALGGEAARGFALVFGFGVIAGTYSSFYVAAPVLGYLNPRDDGNAIAETA